MKKALLKRLWLLSIVLLLLLSAYVYVEYQHVKWESAYYDMKEQVSKEGLPVSVDELLALKPVADLEAHRALMNAIDTASGWDHLYSDKTFLQLQDVLRAQPLDAEAITHKKYQDWLKHHAYVSEIEYICKLIENEHVAIHHLAYLCVAADDLKSTKVEDLVATNGPSLMGKRVVTELLCMHVLNGTIKAESLIQWRDKNIHYFSLIDAMISCALMQCTDYTLLKLVKNGRLMDVELTIADIEQSILEMSYCELGLYGHYSELIYQSSIGIDIFSVDGLSSYMWSNKSSYEILRMYKQMASSIKRGSPTDFTVIYNEEYDPILSAMVVDGLKNSLDIISRQNAGQRMAQMGIDIIGYFKKHNHLPENRINIATALPKTAALFDGKRFEYSLTYSKLNERAFSVQIDSSKRPIDLVSMPIKGLPSDYVDYEIYLDRDVLYVNCAD